MGVLLPPDEEPAAAPAPPPARTPNARQATTKVISIANTTAATVTIIKITAVTIDQNASIGVSTSRQIVYIIKMMKPGPISNDAGGVTLLVFVFDNGPPRSNRIHSMKNVVFPINQEPSTSSARINRRIACIPSMSGAMATRTVVKKAHIMLVMMSATVAFDRLSMVDSLASKGKLSGSVMLARRSTSVNITFGMSKVTGKEDVQLKPVVLDLVQRPGDG